jgi:DNA-binding winged helix-turn-helix (wHTH) protein
VSPLTKPLSADDIADVAAYYAGANAPFPHYDAEDGPMTHNLVRYSPNLKHSHASYLQGSESGAYRRRLAESLQSPDTDKRFFQFFVQRAERARAARTEVLFGPFRLLPTQFLLLEGDKPVHLGSRALEILIVLLERPGELVSKQELMGRVWPNISVEPANLTVHMSALRRALRDGRDGNRFIINVPGRGYSFVASVELSEHENRARPTRAIATLV